MRHYAECFTCDECGTEECVEAGLEPDGWVEVEGLHFCPDHADEEDA